LPETVHVAIGEETLPEADLWVIAVPSHAVRVICSRIHSGSPRVCIASKGLESATSMLLADVVNEALPDANISAISGPNLALEIVRGIPTAAVAASNNLALAEVVRDIFNCRTYRVYASEDLVGVELAGSLKNVLAIGAGMSDGLGYGDNTKGALLARGLGELTRLGAAMGASVETFLGVSGVGDLFATASSHLSRNYRVGRMVGEGVSLADALHSVGQVAEGVSTAESSQVLARRNGVAMPIFEAIDSVLRGRIKALEAVNMLMERMPRSVD
jgi:glycerol-3-phosphate dehydrogenase (NAD(P)+)